MEESSVMYALDVGDPPIERIEVADRDIRLACLHAAIQTFRPGDTDSGGILATARQYFDFVNGSAR